MWVVLSKAWRSARGVAALGFILLLFGHQVLSAVRSPLDLGAETRALPVQLTARYILSHDLSAFPACNSSELALLSIDPPVPPTSIVLGAWAGVRVEKCTLINTHVHPHSNTLSPWLYLSPPPFHRGGAAVVRRTVALMEMSSRCQAAQTLTLPPITPFLSDGFIFSFFFAD